MLKNYKSLINFQVSFLPTSPYNYGVYEFKWKYHTVTQRLDHV